MEEVEYRLKAKKKLLRITFPNGKIICYSNVTNTMIAVLSEVGSDKFPSINMELCHRPLLSKTIYPEYKEWMKPICDGWYINTQSDSENKFLQLRSINEQLSLNLKIEIGTDFEVQKNPNRNKRSRSIDKLLVKFPDGEYIANEKALDTYLEAIWKFGIDNIMRKHLTWGKTDLIATRKIAISQVQVGENRWATVPSTTKDKAKVLKVIGVMLRIPLEITLI